MERVLIAAMACCVVAASVRAAEAGTGSAQDPVKVATLGSTAEDAKVQRSASPAADYSDRPVSAEWKTILVDPPATAPKPGERRGKLPDQVPAVPGL